MQELRYCSECGDRLQPHIIGGEPRNHGWCARCEEPRYLHATVVVTCFVASEDRLLWVQRELPPKRGLWAIPGGFLEAGETLAEGAARELHEEAGILLPPESLQLYMTGAITFINQLYVGFRATVDSDFCLPGPESRDAGFFNRADCPWEEVAYPEVNDTIRQAYDDLERGEFDVYQAEMTAERYLIWPVPSAP